MHSVPCVAIALVFATTCAAQPDHTCNSAQRLLHSASLNDKAWGAYLAASCDLKDLAPEIADQLISQNPEQLSRFRWDTEDFWAAHAMVDALVRLNQPLPPKAFKEIACGFRVEAVILMLQNAPQNIQDLTYIRNSQPKAYESIAAANALVKLRAPGIAAPLLKEMTFNNWVWVSDTGASTVGGTIGSLLGGNANLRIPDDLPPAGLYRITSQPTPGDTLVADGATKMYANRTQFETGRETVWENAPEGYCYQCLRAGYIAELAGIPIDEAKKFIDCNTPVRWADAAATQATVQRSINLQIAGLRHITRQLIAEKLIQPNEIKGLFLVNVHIVDSRTKSAIPMPEIQNVFFHLSN